MTGEDDQFGVILAPRSNGIMSFPGITLETKEKLTKLLQENHIKNDTYFNEKGFHNHLNHHLLAAYSLGASNETLERIFKVHSTVQRPMLPIIDHKINEKNWTDLLGNMDSYSTYLIFFNKVVKQDGPINAIEKYVFQSKDSQMIVRLIGGAFHPFIHIGYGVEFGIDTQVAEGLAQMAATIADADKLFDPEWPHVKREGSILSSFTESLKLAKSSNPSFRDTCSQLHRVKRTPPRKGVSSFDIVNDILGDPRLAAGKTNTLDDPIKFDATNGNSGHIIKEHCEKWVISEDAGWEEIVEKTEELFFLSTVLLAASTRPGFEYRQDFFMAHATTSAIFLPSLLEVLSPPSRIILLHAHFRTTIGYWVSRGRPQLFIKDILMSASDRPINPLVKEAKGSVPESMKAYVWSDIIDSAVHHHDEHVSKILRTYIYAASHFGDAAPGLYKSSLPESELLDGTIFVRAAGIILESLGRPVKEMYTEWWYRWDRSCLGYEEAWDGRNGDRRHQ